MLNGKSIKFETTLAQRIVDLRLSGLTWRQIDELLFPGAVHKDTRCGSFAGDFCQKHRSANPILEGAFTKKVYGYGTPTQIVVKLRDRIVPMATPAATSMEMFI